MLAELADELVREARLTLAGMERTERQAALAVKAAQEAGDAQALAASEHLLRSARTRAAATRRSLERLHNVVREITIHLERAVPPQASAAPRKPICDIDGHEMQPDPLAARTPADLTAALRAYRVWAGMPSFRDMARIAACGVSYSRLCTALGKDKDKLPRQEVIEAAIKGCGGGEEDIQRFVTAWRQVAMSAAQARLSAKAALSGTGGRPGNEPEPQAAWVPYEAPAVWPVRRTGSHAAN
jgi:hypothetical protein